MKKINSKHPLYSTWGQIVHRCCSVKCEQYAQYGGRGIKMFRFWRNNFKMFSNYIEEHLGPKPSKKHTLDRINNDGNYEPGNVRWATQKEQMRNTRVNRIITYKGEARCLSEWAEIYGLGPKTLEARLCKLNWGVEKALTTPAAPKPKKLVVRYGGRLMTLGGLSKVTGIKRSLLYQRIVRDKLSVEESVKHNRGLVLYNGEHKTLKDIAEENGLDPGTFRQRVGQYGMSIEEAVSNPLRRKFSYEGEERSLQEIAKMASINDRTLDNRIYRSGMTLEKALSVPIRKQNKNCC